MSTNKQENQVCNWAFRMNADLPYETVKASLRLLCKAWVFQKEQGEETGYIHYQGRFSLHLKARKNELIKRFTDNGFAVPNYLAPELKTGEAEFYAQKIETRIEGPWSDKDADIYIPRQLRNINTLRPWQAHVLAQHMEFDPRSINWVFDEAGNHGKSILASYMSLRYGAIDMPPVNDSEKLIATLCDILIGTQNRTPGTIFIDLPRCLTKDKLNGFLSAAEQIKKGHVMDLRNHYKDWRFDSPQVWIFSNTPAPNSDLSADRWITWIFDERGRFVSNKGTIVNP